MKSDPDAWPNPRHPSTRYRVGAATGIGHGFFSVAIEDTWFETVFPLGDLERAYEVCEALNQGMPNPLMAGINLRFTPFRPREAS